MELQAHQSESMVITQLRKRRVEMGLSQRDVDDMIECAEGLVSKWECGDRVPHFGSISKWADALNCHLMAVPNDTPQQA